MPRTFVAPATPPVKILAGIGGLLLTFEIWVIGRWVTGPRFERVNSGPDSPPHWMKVVLNTWQIAGLFVLAVLLYRFVVRPWRREGRIGTDGLFCLSFLFLSFQDPLSSYNGHWFTYNSYLVNWGSYVNDIPGWNAFGRPGQMLASPLVLLVPAYVYICCGAMRLGGAVMRAAGRRWPRLGALGLASLCFGAMAILGLVAEALIMMPLGVYTYAGGPAALNGTHYFKYPVAEMFLFAGLVTSVAVLRYFTNDRSETIAERGVDQLRVTGGARTLVRFLAITAAVNLGMFLTYNLPASWFGTHSSTWPQDIQDRSYLTSHLCGPGTDRACPGPMVPLPRPHSAYFDPAGNPVRPR